MTLTVGSLFSGIGGIDLGLERAGMTVKWHSEIDPYACRVLKKHWPDVPNLGNIKEIDWANVEPVDVIAGGYPCQPFSIAGNRQGDKDERHLWPYFLRAISELRPRFALLENVRGHLSMGFDRVLGDLAEIGYDAEWQIVSAASVGAPHRRDRIICVAYPSKQYSNGKSDYARNSMGSETLSEFGNSGRSTNVADADEQYFYDRGHRKSSSTIEGRSTLQKQIDRSGCAISNDECFGYGQHWIAADIATTSRIWRNDRNRTEGYVGWQWWETEPDVGRVAYGIPSRVDRLRGLGNAVVPQVAEYVGRLILQSLT
jgi:DNA (cytosine-5)-methyltransferase 1